MKKLFLAFILIHFLAVNSSAWISPSHTEMVGGGTTCQSLSAQANADGSTTIGNNAVNYYRGFLFIDAANSHNACEYHAWLTKTGGSITGKTFYAQIWTIDGSNNLLVQQGSDSDGITGSDAWSDTEVTFTWASPITMAANTTYAMVLTMKEVDAVNYASLRRMDEQNTWAYCLGIGGWEADLDNNGNLDVEDDPKVEVYTMQ